MIPLEYPKYKMILIGGPKDGHVEFVKFLDPTMEYYTSPGRIAVYIETDVVGRYLFDGYKRVLEIEGPSQKIQFYPDFDILEGS